VHGDFKPGNALVDGDRIAAMLDWETAHLGDPLEDLGWITNPVRAREHQIQGLWERADIVAAYSAATGHSVEEEELTWWNVFSCWKLAVIVLTGIHAFVAGTFDWVHQSPTWLVRAMLRMIDSEESR
jgi:aminoglycoside phosphotransferase (APT) family kinase protein